MDEEPTTRPYPFGESWVVDIGDEHFISWDDDGLGLLWHHPGCRPWAHLSFKPFQSTGHVLVDGSPERPERLTIRGSLLCPMGCGDHGFIELGRWRAA